MKTIIMILAVTVAGSVGFSQARHDVQKTQQHQGTTTKYTCPMHPEVVKTKPGKCPKCEMTLVAMKKKPTKKGKSMSGMKM